MSKCTGLMVNFVGILFINLVTEPVNTRATNAHSKIFSMVWTYDCLRTTNPLDLVDGPCEFASILAFVLLKSHRFV